jgi:hypothetical protein
MASSSSASASASATSDEVVESKFDKQIRYKENQIIELNTKIEKWNVDITQCLYSDITNDLFNVTYNYTLSLNETENNGGSENSVFLNISNSDIITKHNDLYINR